MRVLTAKLQYGAKQVNNVYLMISLLQIARGIINWSLNESIG